MYSRLRRWQTYRLDNFDSIWSEGVLGETTRSFEKATRFPAPNEIQPTRLGNALAAGQKVINDRYGIDIALLWSQMEATPELKDAAALTAVKDQKASLDLLAALVAVLVAFGVEGLLYFTARDAWASALASLLALLAGYIAYGVAVNVARQFMGAMAVVFDLHREKLKTALALDGATAPAAEKQWWVRATQTLRPGLTDAPAAAAAAPGLAVHTPADVRADVVTKDVIDRDEPLAKGRFVRAIEYVFVVSRLGTNVWVGDAEFVVDDTRVGRIGWVPVPVEGSATATILGEATPRLAWRVRGLPSGSSAVVAYQLPLWYIHAEPEPTLEFAHGRIKLQFPVSAAQFSIELETWAGGVRRPDLRVGGQSVPLPGDEWVFSREDVLLGADRTAWLELS